MRSLIRGREGKSARWDRNPRDEQAISYKSVEVCDVLTKARGARKDFAKRNELLLCPH